MEETLRIKLESMFQEADRLINEKAIAEGYNMLMSIIEEEPTFGKAFNHLGWIYETQYKDYVKAETNYKRALELSPEYNATYYNFAVILSMQQRWDDLNNLLSKALTIPGINRGTIYNEYGIMYETQGRYKEAIEAYKKYIANTFNNKHVDTAKESIDRCKKKMDILGTI